MAEFLPQARQTILAFAESMAMSGEPKAGPDGSYTFLFESSGTVSLLPTPDGRNVMVAVGRQPIVDDEAAMLRLFMNAGLEVLTVGALHAGIAPNGDYYLATIIPNHRFDLPTLETTLNECFAVHDAAA